MGVRGRLSPPAGFRGSAPVPFLPFPGSSARLPLRPASRGVLPLCQPSQPFRLRPRFPRFCHSPTSSSFPALPTFLPSLCLQRVGTPGTGAARERLQYPPSLFMLYRFKESFSNRRAAPPSGRTPFRSRVGGRRGGVLSDIPRRYSISEEQVLTKGKRT